MTRVRLRRRRCCALADGRSLGQGWLAAMLHIQPPFGSPPSTQWLESLLRPRRVSASRGLVLLWAVPTAALLLVLSLRHLTTRTVMAATTGGMTAATDMSAR